MDDVRTFKSYNFVTGAVDGTMAYDFSNPGLYGDEEIYDLPEEEAPRRRQKTRRKQLPQQQEWIKEDVRPDVRQAAVAVRNHQGVSIVSLLGAAVALVLLTMMLLAQIRLTDISDTAAKLEDQIAELELERDKLTVEYETTFNLKEVEQYAVDVLGMQEPDSQQIFYLTGVASADKAVVITKDDTDMFSLGVADILSSIKAYFS